ncbi:DNA mismatch repair protein MutS [Serpentinicella alkaliphila]|uniref:DNA mismatch repair protein MutS n=1 Tax=Serpentinicella alkaliphila TaxID=1734049 RepID=A0A4R2TZP6_9FIRM|nr:DNA mismatch repair protein MutS [Serpentinicella alkaliphila]QUH26497.1 DNA mismatch repair protein MutS [Serpentinicella alkaliphila]TCQ03219.1 DNA mismatch repair protein MutS [Serpentinicella alkaliphila]
MKKYTPMMEQYLSIKDNYKDSLVFFRLGDFYELFFEDAIIASRELEIVLTGRECGQEERAPMCGVPHHSVDTYIDRLVTKGYKVAICEQVEDASVAVGIVKRDVVRVITPGTLIDTQLLEDKKNNYLASVIYLNNGWGLSYTDISTGELFATEIVGESKESRLMNELAKIQPRELIYYVEDSFKEQLLIKLQKSFNYYLNPFHIKTININDLIGLVESLNITNISNSVLEHNIGLKATKTLLAYISETQKRTLNHMNQLTIYDTNETMDLDIISRVNLELTETIRGKSKKGSLLWLLDKTVTAMGGRALRKWIDEPLINIDKITERLDAIEYLKNEVFIRVELKEYLKKIYDIERISGKISYGSANPKDLISLKNSLKQLPHIKYLFNDCKSSFIINLFTGLNDHEEIVNLIETAIADEAPLSIKEGGIIKSGYSEELDELRRATTEGRIWISNLEKEEKEKSGIKSLKVGYNKIFGYYIEVTKSNLHLVPESFIRKQTLANCERYVTPELKEVESKILGAQDKIVALEYELYINIRNFIGNYIESIQRTARAIGQLDVVYSLAQVAEENNYIKPQINNGTLINIEEGRHPVVEKVLDNEMFIANDTSIDSKYNRMSIITGPNMAGKSTYMRQVALIVLMAQIGSFVPARNATIGIVDRIFTRVGASDDLSQGQSTFMVEMSEVANILNNATEKSLLILDEVGRGTSTFDGLSIAWAIIEYLNCNIMSKTLFSTHYHELTELESIMEHVKNYRITVKEDGDNIVFLRKIIEGSADKSYGIQVANIAGLPSKVIQRAKELLEKLEEKDIAKNREVINEKHKETGNIEEVKIEEVRVEYIPNTKENEIIDQLKSINLLETTPLEAMNILYKLHNKATKS